MQASIEALAGELMTIPLSLLVPSSNRNARRTGGTNVDDLMASIEAQGLMQNLIVCPADPTRKGRATQRYEVVGGGRRLRALRELAARGRIRKDEHILCRVKPTREAAEASLAENHHREAMHPADEFEAFQRLMKDGASVEDIAQRFGTSPLTVRRRIKLAGVHPELRQLYRDGGMALDQLMALALSDDPEQQLVVWNNAPAWCRDARNLRSLFVQDEVEAATDALAKFVGVEGYESAGGSVRRDLFSETGDGYLQDAALLDRLAAERLALIADEIRAEGWSWVDVVLRASSVELHRFAKAQKAKRGMTRAESKQQKALVRRLKELEHKLESLDEAGDDGLGDDSGDDTNHGAPADDGSIDEAEKLEQVCDDLRVTLRALEEGLSTYDAEAKACAGSIVCVGRDGRVQVHRGLVRPADRTVQRFRRTEGKEGEAESDAPRAKGRPTHSAALMRELTAHRTLAARAAMLERPDVALTALLQCLVQRVVIDSYVREGSAVKLVTNAPDAGLSMGSAGTLGPARATGVLAEARQRWGDRIPGDPGRLLVWLAGLSEPDRKELLALCVALTINDVRAEEQAGTLDPLCILLGLDMADWWEARRETYFERVTKDTIAGAITEAAGPEVAARYKGASKGELARVAERDLSGLRWLPAPLRAPGDDEDRHGAN